MGLVDDFLLGGNDEVDGAFGTKIMACNGQTFDVVWNDARKSFDGEVGGLEPNVQAVGVAQPSDVTNPLQMLNKRCTVGGISYRVAEVVVGTVAIHFTLIDPNESR
jgi:hypothetical protein